MAETKASVGRGWRVSTIVLIVLLICVIVVGITVPLVYRNRLYQVEVVVATTPTQFVDCGSVPCVSGVGTCVNLVAGGYTCLCAPGFKGPGCDQDVDECAAGADNCDYYTTSCRNTFGSFRCQCKAGYTPMSSTARACQDVNECLSDALNGCDNATTGCANTFGSYQCYCKPGFNNILNDVCADVDECAAGIDDCDMLSTTCANTIGSFRCPCLPGYSRLNTRQCIPVDFCATNPCTNGGDCVGFTGGYNCSCLPGFAGPTCAITTNECASMPCLNRGLCLDGINSFMCTCPLTFTGPTCAIPIVSRIAVNAERESAYMPLDTCPVLYDEVTVNDGNYYSLCTGKFTPPQAGVFWFHLSADVPANTAITLTLQGTTGPSPAISSNQTGYNGAYTLSRDALTNVVGGTDIFLTTVYPLYGAGVAETGLAAFRVDMAVGTVAPVMFSVTYSASGGQAGQVPFDTVLVSTGAAWSNQSGGGSFTAPASGIYLFSYSLGVPAASQLNANLLINGSESTCASTWNTITQTGTELLSRSCLQMLTAGSTVALQTNGAYISGPAAYPTSMAGFLYNPDLPLNEVAWYVQRTAAATTGIQQPLTFDMIDINMGGTWESVSQQAVINVPGLYYLRLDALACFSAPLNLTVCVNNAEAFDVRLQVRTGDGGFNLGRASLVELRRNDYVTVTQDDGSCVDGGANGETAFYGFLVYPR